MNYWPDNLKIEALDGKEFALLAPFSYVRPSGEVITVDTVRNGDKLYGFVTDFASIPRILWPIMSPFKFKRAATVHDYLYATGDRPREEADAILREAAYLDGCTTAEALAIWLGVRAGGWLPWRNNRKRKDIWYHWREIAA